MKISNDYIKEKIEERLEDEYAIREELKKIAFRDEINNGLGLNEGGNLRMYSTDKEMGKSPILKQRAELAVILTM